MDVREHADRWLAAWNARDLDAIMDCYAEDVDFVAPTVVARWKRSDGRLRGAAELRQHFQRGLEFLRRIGTLERLIGLPRAHLDNAWRPSVACSLWA